MTDKKGKILDAALELFAKEGFKSTSTSKVAKLAGVSEGLIFRHFANKEGLLQAIVEEGEQRAKMLFADIVMETNPKEVIKKTLEIANTMILDNQAANFWKLQYKIKWELEQYGEQKMEPLNRALTHAFAKLNYKQPEQEANALLISLDGLATRFFLQSDFDLIPVLTFLKEKYEI